MTARVNHASLYANDPKGAAAKLAKLVGGRAAPFHAIEGGWFCFLTEREHWDAPLIELYPRNVSLGHKNGSFVVKKLDTPAHGAGGHVNITVSLTRAELEKRCKALRIPCSWREWQSLLEVWIEDDVLIEVAPS